MRHTGFERGGGTLRAARYPDLAQAAVTPLLTSLDYEPPGSCWQVPRASGACRWGSDPGSPYRSLSHMRGLGKQWGTHGRP